MDRGSEFAYSAEHNGPHSDKLGLVDVAVVVDVKRVYELARPK